MAKRPSETLSNAERYKNLNARQVLEYIGSKHRSTLWKYVQLGKLPQPRYLSPYRPVWRLGEVLDALERNLEPAASGKRGFRGDAKKARSPSKLERMRERFGLNSRSTPRGR